MQKTILFFTTFLFLIIIQLLLSSNNLLAQDADCNDGTARLDMDVNNVNAGLFARGNLFLDSLTVSAVYEVPKGSGKHSIYSAGLWMGGIDSGNDIRVAAQSHLHPKMVLNLCWEVG